MAMFALPLVRCFGHKTFRTPVYRLEAYAATTDSRPQSSSLLALGISWTPFSRLASPGVGAYLRVFISIDEWNQFLRSLHVLSVGIPELTCQHSLFHPDSIEEQWDQDEHSQEASQTRKTDWHANAAQDYSQIDWMSHEPIDAMRNESMIVSYDKGRGIESPKCTYGDDVDGHSNDKESQPDNDLD
jgi:hypothetical protein